MDNISTQLRIAELIKKQIRNEISDAEAAELDAWANDNEHNKVLFRQLNDLQYREAALKQMGTYDTDAAFKRVLKIAAAPVVTMQSRHLSWKRIIRYAAAVLLFGGTGLAIFLSRSHSPGNRKTIASSVYKNDLMPGRQEAVLLLSNGKSINLSAKHDSAFTMANSSVHLKNGTIAYNKIGTAATTNQFNTLITTAGKTFALTLEDGTQVWLNAASSLKYPVHFSGNTRSVELCGEAFFSVRHNGRQPFIVKVNGKEIRDLGTEFNVNAYPDEARLRAALISGRIMVSNGKKRNILRPGQQASLTAGHTVVTAADISSITAWKNGLFIFHNEPITEMMKTIGRWYNARIVYSADFVSDNAFTGEISRNVLVSKLLTQIEISGLAHFTISGQTITVYPYKEQ